MGFGDVVVAGSGRDAQLIVRQKVETARQLVEQRLLDGVGELGRARGRLGVGGASQPSASAATAARRWPEATAARR